MSKPTATRTYLRIGQIAERTGVSSRALRLYERRGLLQPCTHSQAGYRLYGPDALHRLMQIVVLKRSGFTLAQIGELLSSQTPVVAAMLDDRVGTLQREIADKMHALTTLRTLCDRLACASTLDLDQLLESITMTDNLNLSATQAQREEIRTRAEKFHARLAPDERARMHERLTKKMDELGAVGIEALQRPWRELSAQIRAAMAAATPVGDPLIAALAHRWHAHVTGLVAQDPAFLDKLRDLYTRYPGLMVEQSMSPAMMDYMNAALAAAGLNFKT